MSLLWSLCCLVICAIALGHLNDSTDKTSMIRRTCLVLVASGAFGGVLRPVAPDWIESITDLMLVAGLAIDVSVRRFRPQWYADQPESWFERTLSRIYL